MKTIIIIIALVIILFLVMPGASESPQARGIPSCPPGYYDPGTFQTWGGWEYNCLPIGQTSTLLGVPHATYARPLQTIYKPMVAGTGIWPAQTAGEPADRVYIRK
jgi:hypothetical protein